MNEYFGSRWPNRDSGTIAPLFRVLLILRLIQFHFHPARQAHRRDQAPALVGDRPGEFDAPGLQRIDGLAHVVAEERDAVTFAFRWVAADFALGHVEDQPAVADVAVL